jgi:hypothetical protein
MWGVIWNATPSKSVPYMQASGSFNALTAVLSWKIVKYTLWKGGCVEPRAGMDARAVGPVHRHCYSSVAIVTVWGNDNWGVVVGHWAGADAVLSLTAQIPMAWNDQSPPGAAEFNSCIGAIPQHFHITSRCSA